MTNPTATPRHDRRLPATQETRLAAADRLAAERHPAWLTALAAAWGTGQFPQAWTTEEVAAHLGVKREYARVALRAARIRPVMRASGPGSPYLYSPLDIEELRHRREKFPHGVSSRTAAQRARDAKRARYAARQMVDGRLVAVKATEHGSESTYNNHGCRCEQCVAAHSVKMAARYRPSSAPHELADVPAPSPLWTPPVAG